MVQSSKPSFSDTIRAITIMTDLSSEQALEQPPGNTRKERILYIWRNYVRYYKWMLFGSIAAGALSAWASGFGYPFMIKKVFPIVFGNEQLSPEFQAWLVRIVGEEHLHITMVWVAAAFLPFIVAVSGLAGFLNMYWLTAVGMKILERFRTKLYTKYQLLSLSYHEKHKSGDLLSRLMHDTQFLQEGILSTTNDLILQPMMMIGALGYLIYMSFQSAQFCMLMLNMILVGLCIVPIQKIGRSMLNQARKAQAGLGDITASLQENFSSQRDIRAYGMEETQIKTVRTQIKGFLSTMLNVVRWQNVLTPVVEIASAFAIGISLYVGSVNGLGVDDFIAIATAMYLCYEPVKKLGAVHNRLTMCMVGLDRINAILFEPDDLPDPEIPVPLTRCRGDIEFDHVKFSYDGEKAVMNDISLKIPAGQIVALVGPSGAGKTTFANLVCRFYDVTSGAIRIDGVDVRQYRKADLMRNISLVSQYPVLFRGTVAENIHIGNLSATRSAILDAGRRAAVDEIAKEDPNGYDRMIGESGEGLSGGQKQRVSIARAFLKNAPLLILDEATAALDMRSEARIQDQIDSLAQGRTTLIIAHRFSTIRNADRILLFEQGRIIADGNHAELYEKSALYRDLYDKQLMKQEGGNA